MGADVDQGIAEDVYLLKPNNNPDKSVELAVTHLSRVDHALDPKAPTVLLLHGQYQNRGVFWQRGERRLARDLVELGFDVWIPELRGHGLSPVNDHFEQTTLIDYARYDLPAIAMFVAEQREGKSLHWLACGHGAGALLMSLALGSLDSLPIASLLGAGAPFGHANWATLPGTAALLAARHRVNPDWGPEREATPLLAELFSESQWFQVRGKSVGLDLWRQLASGSVKLSWLGHPNFLINYDEGLKSLYQSDNLTMLPSGTDQIDALLTGRLTDSAMLDDLQRSISNWQRFGVQQRA